MISKKLLISFIFLFSSFLGFAQAADNGGTTVAAGTEKTGLQYVNFFTREVEHRLSAGQEARNFYEFTHYTLDHYLSLQADMKELKVYSGINTGYYGLNFTFDNIYAPTFFNCLNAGVRIIQHFDFSNDYYFDYDFLGGVYLEYNPFRQLSVKTSVLYHKKSGVIIDLENGFLRNHGAALDVSCSYSPVDWFNATVSMSSFNFFRYYLFFSPIFSGMVEFKLNDSISMSFKEEALFVDFFNLSANFNNLCSTISIIWRF